MNAIVTLKYLLEKAEAETQPEEQIVTLSVPVDIVREILTWADEAQEAVNNNAKLVGEEEERIERLKHELYGKDGQISALKFAIRELCKKEVERHGRFD